METFLEVLKYAGYAITALAGLLTFLIPFVKSAKAKKALETAKKIAESVQPCIVEAEAFVNYTGEEKKAYVMTKANNFAIANGLEFDADKISTLIDNIVELTKKVNQRDKDKAK